MGSRVKITSEGKRHHGAVISSEAFKVSYAKSLVDDWIKQLKLLFKIAESEPQSALLAFLGGFRGKPTYFIRTIPSLGELLKPLEDVIRCGLAVPLFHNEAKYECENSRKLTSSLTQLIKDQYQIYTVNKTEQKSIKLNIKINKEELYKATLIELRTQLDENTTYDNYTT